MILIVRRGDSAAYETAEAFGIDAITIFDQREGEYLLIDLGEVGLDLIVADAVEAIRLVLTMLAHGLPPESIFPPPEPIRRAILQARH